MLVAAAEWVEDNKHDVADNQERATAAADIQNPSNNVADCNYVIHGANFS
jgi:hypothetical protein